MISRYRAALARAIAESSVPPLVQRWSDGRRVFYPRGARLGLGQEEPQWEEAPRGVVLAVTTVHEHSHPEYQTETPFTLVIVDAQGARFVCRLANSVPRPSIGTTVSLKRVVDGGSYRIVAS